MDEILARCGYRCDLCLAYRPNVEREPANRPALSDGWFEYFGFRIPPERIVCDGCLAEGGARIDTVCPVRPCVIERGLRHCGECPAFGCERLGERFVNYEEIAARRPHPISESDRALFIAPYENRHRLEVLRSRPG